MYREWRRQIGSPAAAFDGSVLFSSLLDSVKSGRFIIGSNTNRRVSLSPTILRPIESDDGWGNVDDYTKVNEVYNYPNVPTDTANAIGAAPGDNGLTNKFFFGEAQNLPRCITRIDVLIRADFKLAEPDTANFVIGGVTLPCTLGNSLWSITSHYGAWDMSLFMSLAANADYTNGPCVNITKFATAGKNTTLRNIQLWVYGA